MGLDRRAGYLTRHNRLKDNELIGETGAMHCWIYLFMAVDFMSITPVASRAGTGELESEFRCGTDLVELRDERFEVLRKCGPPQSKEPFSGSGESLWEKWIHGTSSGDYHVLTVMDGVLIRMREVPGDWRSVWKTSSAGHS